MRHSAIKNIETLNTGIKQRLLQIATMDVIIDGKKSPLLNKLAARMNATLLKKL